MINRITPKSREKDVLVQELSGETLVYDLKTNKAFCLNESLGLVWQECTGQKSVDEIAENVGRKLNSPVSSDFVWLALDQLKEENLLTDTDLTKINRREVIKKVGLASLVALPVISALIAPPAINAASTACVEQLEACTTTEECCPVQQGTAICESNLCLIDTGQ